MIGFLKKPSVWASAMVGLATAGPVEVAGADALPGVSAHLPWSLTERVDDPDGYVLSQRDVPDSEFRAFRLEARIQAPARAVAAAFRKIVTDPNVSPKHMKKTLLREDENVIVIYSYIEMPLVSDRDVTSRVVTSFDPETGSHRFEWSSTDEGPAPKAGVVRLRKSSGSWAFTPLAHGATFAVYESHAEIEGAIPSWLVNSLLSGSVVDGLASLRARVEQDQKQMAAESGERFSRAQ